LIAGFSVDGQPRIFQTDPSGACSEWRATALGKSGKQVKDYLEKNWAEGLTEEAALKLTAKVHTKSNNQSLMDVVESGNKNIELCVVSKEQCRYLTEAQIDALIEQQQ
jgi:20S proteasome subunit alpha 4